MILNLSIVLVRPSIHYTIETAPQYQKRVIFYVHAPRLTMQQTLEEGGRSQPRSVRSGQGAGR